MTFTRENASGAKNGNAKLTASQAKEILKIRRQFKGKRVPNGHPASLQVLARRFGIGIAQVGRIANGLHWHRQ